MSRAVALLSLVFILNACDNLGRKQGTILGNNLPGLGDLYAPSADEKADKEWWDNYYGKKSGE